MVQFMNWKWLSVPTVFRSKKSAMREFAEAEFDAARRQLRETGKRTAIDFDFVFTEREHLVNHRTREVGRLAEIGITHDVEIDEARESQRIAQSAATGFLDIHQQFGGIVQLQAGEQRQYS